MNSLQQDNYDNFIARAKLGKWTTLRRYAETVP